MTTTGAHPKGREPYWRRAGTLGSRLLRFDGQVGAVVNTEKQVIVSGVVPGRLAGQLGRIAQQMGLSSGNGVVEQPSSAQGFEPVKPGFTRQGGSFRRQGSPHGSANRESE